MFATIFRIPLAIFCFLPKIVIDGPSMTIFREMLQKKKMLLESREAVRTKVPDKMREVCYYFQDASANFLLFAKNSR